MPERDETRRPLPDEDQVRSTEIGLGGAVSGMLAGIVMALVAMIWAGIQGMGFWLPLKQIAAIFYGVSALIGEGGVVLVGLIVHLVVAALWGMVYASFVRRSATAGTSLIGGLVFGVAVWAIMTWLVLPWANPVMAERVVLISGAWFVYHLVFGASLLIVPAMERWAARQAVPAPA